MEDNNYKLKTLNELTKLKKLSEVKTMVCSADLLDLFANYVYLANPDYRYNETYLKDKIQSFLSSVGVYYEKVKLRKEILESIEKIHIPKNVIYYLSIQIDETWGLRLDNRQSNNRDVWVKTICEAPKLSSVKATTTYLKCQFYSEELGGFTGYLISEKKNELKEYAYDAVRSFFNRFEENNAEDANN